MDLSIIIPHYESVKPLRLLLDSIPWTDNIETIVVDDKSKEQKEDWCLLKEEYGARHITFLDNTTDKKGAGVCRNIALPHARGTWLLFADADDCLTEDVYKKLEPYIGGECSGMEDIIYFPPTSVNILTGELSDRHKIYEEMIREYRMSPVKKNENALRFVYNSPCSKLIRRDMVEQNHIRFDEVLVSNDVMFSTKCGYYARKIAASDQIIYRITYNGQGLTSKKDYNAVCTRLAVNKRKYDFLREHISKKDMAGIPLGNYYFIKWSLQYGFSFGETCSIIKYIAKNRMPLINRELLCKNLRKKLGRSVSDAEKR